VEVYSIGFGKHSAADFFRALKVAGIQRLLDVRLNNISQLAGFTKRDDLRFFLKEICGAEYRHELDLAPSGEILSAYRRREMSWVDYERAFLDLMVTRRVDERFGPDTFDVPTVLLCSEPTAAKCHRRLVLEYLHSTSIPHLVAVHL
jgi:uncharacterized protein (DUF488 family)